MSSRPTRHTAPPGIIARTSGALRSLLILVLVVAALAALGLTFVFKNLDGEIRARVEAKFANHYSNLTVSVREARRIPGEGIEVRGLSLSEPGGESLAYVDELFFACNTDLTEWATREPDIGQIVLRRMKLRLEARRDGSWNLEKLVPLPPSQGNPTVSIEDAQIEFVAAAGSGRPLVLTDVDLQITPEARHPTPADASANESASESPRASPSEPRRRIQGSFSATDIGRIDVQALLDPSQAAWSLSGSASDVVISPRLMASLPPIVAQHAKGFSGAQGRAQFRFQARSPREPGQPIAFALTGTVTEGRITDPRLPFPLADLTAEFACDNLGVSVRNLRARNGATEVQLSLQRQGYAANSPLHVQAKLRQLTLDQRLFASLPQSGRSLWPKLLPSGAIHVDLDLTLADNRLETTIVADCLDVSFSYDKFPYRLTGGRGRVTLRDGIVETRDFQAMASGEVVHLDMKMADPGANAIGWLTIRADGPVPLDGKLVAALEPTTQEIVRALDPVGMIRLHEARLSRDNPAERFSKHVELEVLNGSLRYEKFPYPIAKITGWLEMHDRSWTFRDLTGFHGSGDITCEGKWVPHPERGGQLQLNFVGTHIPLDDELRRALRPFEQRVWTQLQPIGTIDRLAANVGYDSVTKGLSLQVTAEKDAPERDLEGRAISIKPAWFPYQLDGIRGTFHYRNGVVDLQDVRATHGPTTIVLDGECRTQPDGQWSFKLSKLAADRLSADEDLLVALPEPLSKAIRKLNIRGPLHLHGKKLDLAGTGRAGGSVSSSWDLFFDIYDGSLESGIRLDGIHGGVRLAGTREGHKLKCDGTLDIDSVIFKGAQLTQLTGPFWFDQNRVLFGSWSQQGRQGEPQQLTAKAFAGQLFLDGEVLFDTDATFRLKTSLSKASLTQLSREMANGRPDISGEAYALIHLNGTNKLPQLRGSGKVLLRDADIYELPLMVSMLKLLTVKRPDSTAFTTADIDFQVAGDHLYFNTLDFKGDAISLHGIGGWLNFQRELSLKFSTRVGRSEIKLPLIAPLLDEASRSIFEIDVTGTLDQPDVRRTAFPEIFQDTTSTRSRAPKVWSR